MGIAYSCIENDILFKKKNILRTNYNSGLSDLRLSVYRTICYYRNIDTASPFSFRTFPLVKFFRNNIIIILFVILYWLPSVEPPNLGLQRSVPTVSDSYRVPCWGLLFCSHFILSSKIRILHLTSAPLHTTDCDNGIDISRTRTTRPYNIPGDVIS